MPDGGPSRRSVLVAAGGFWAAGLAGRAVRHARPTARSDSARGGRSPLDLVVYNADDARHEVSVRVEGPASTAGASAGGDGLAAEGRRVHLSAERALDPSTATEFEDAIPAPGEPATFTVAVRSADGTPARRALLLGPPRDPSEVHAVVRTSGRIDLSVVGG